MGMSIEEAIERYKNNAEYERTHGNLQGCLEFRQLVEWLRKYQKIQEIVKNTQQLCSYGSAFIDIREVLEDGNND